MSANSPAGICPHTDFSQPLSARAERVKKKVQILHSDFDKTCGGWCGSQDKRCPSVCIYKST